MDIGSKDYLPAATAGGRANKLSSYVMDGAVVGFPPLNNYSSPYTPMRATAVWSPLCYLIWEPDEFSKSPPANEYNDGSNDPNTAGETIGLLHSKNGGNALALDGHSDFVTTLQFTKTDALNAGPGPGGKTFLFWDNVNANGH